MRRLILCLLLLLPLSAAAQPTGTVKDAMDRIEKTFGVYFVYDAGLPVDTPTSYKVDSGKTLQKNLRGLFENTGIMWYVKEKYVVLMRRCGELRPAPVWPDPAGSEPERPVRVDTLVEAVKTALYQTDRLRTGAYRLDPLQTRRVVTPLGEGDAIKYVLTLPGVSSGGEGGTAWYVRGGSMGSNRVTLDDVPIYGVSHLMGLVSVVPGDIIGASEFRMGGFRADEGNLTASHLRMQSYSGDFERARARFSVNPFLLSASVSTPMEKGKSSFLGSVRMSPVGLEYKALQNVVNGKQSIFDDMRTKVGDVYAKFTWRPNSRDEVALSLFGSLDDYHFDKKDEPTQGMKWGNLIANLSWKISQALGFDQIHTAISFNDHAWEQNTGSTYERYPSVYITESSRINSRLDEVSFRSTSYKRLNRFSFQAGISLSGARFNPEAIIYEQESHQSQKVKESRKDHIFHTLTASLYGETGYEIPERFQVRLALRANGYYIKEIKEEVDNPLILENSQMFHPEASLITRFYVMPQWGVEGTVDYRVQYYHCLEGVSLGWAMDPITPSMSKTPPERVMQEYLGFFGGFGEHALRAGAFYKQMHDIAYLPIMSTYYKIYFHLPGSAFSGNGDAYGAEFHYEKNGRDLSWRLSYTWSKTTYKFFLRNQGNPFPAKYDRRHMLEATARWKGLTAVFTFQSGHYETVSPIDYAMSEQANEFMYQLLPNNLQVPSHIRLDLGYQFSFRTGKSAIRPLNHNLTIGVYNLLNRSNPSMVLFDTTARKWKYVSFFPTMPSISYTLEL